MSGSTVRVDGVRRVVFSGCNPHVVDIWNVLFPSNDDRYVLGIASVYTDAIDVWPFEIVSGEVSRKLRSFMLDVPTCVLGEYRSDVPELQELARRAFDLHLLNTGRARLYHLSELTKPEFCSLSDYLSSSAEEHSIPNRAVARSNRA